MPVILFGIGKRSDQIEAIKNLNDQIRHLWKFLDSDRSDVDMTKTECMDQIVKLQNTMNEAVRRICGLEY